MKNSKRLLTDFVQKNQFQLFSAKMKKKTKKIKSGKDKNRITETEVDRLLYEELRAHEDQQRKVQLQQKRERENQQAKLQQEDQRWQEELRQLDELLRREEGHDQEESEDDDLQVAISALCTVLPTLPVFPQKIVKLIDSMEISGFFCPSDFT